MADLPPAPEPPSYRRRPPPWHEPPERDQPRWVVAEGTIGLAARGWVRVGGEVHAVFELASPERPPLPWVTGLNELIFALIEEDGQWRLLLEN